MPVPSQERLSKDVRRVLRSPFWLPELQSGELYERLHDDHDGTHEGRVQIYFTPDGDAYLNTDLHQGPPLRFRNTCGGSNSKYVRNALMILAYAIKLDNEEEASRREASR